MATPSQIFTEMVSTTLREHKKYLVDNVTNNNALLQRLQSRGKITRVDGGYEIACPLEYAENATYQRYSGYQILNIQASDVITSAMFPWRQAAVHVTASGLELRQNSGKNQIINLVRSRMKNAMNTAANQMSGDVYSDGLLANQINGLQVLVADNGQGTVGGINSGTWEFWRNNVQDANAPLQGGSSITPSASTIQSLMLPLWLECSRGNDTPDLIPTSNDYFTFYEESLTDLKRYGTNDTANGGFVSLKYKNADVVFDGGDRHGSGIPDSHMYFLNTDYIGLTVHRDADWDEVGDQRSVNQDAVVMPLIWQGNMTVSNRSLQGVLLDNG